MAEFWSSKSGSRPETTLTYSSGTSVTLTDADSLPKGQKGDNHQGQGDFDNAAKSNNLPVQLYPSDQPHERMRDKFLALLKLLSYKSTSTGPLFPGSDESHKPTAESNASNIKIGVETENSNVQASMDILMESMVSVSEVHAALESHYKSSLVIRRASGDELDLRLCYVNLAVVEARGQRDKDKRDLKSRAVAFQRIPSLKESTDADMTPSMPLENLFDKRKLPNGGEYVPKRILVHGRAGIGKSTLCKKLVHLYQGGLWRDRFDAVLWLPLRQLRSYNYRNVNGLLNERYFSSQPKRAALSRTVSAQIDAGRVLFILDGLDEIVTSTGEEENDTLKFLLDLLKKEHVVITSRPSGIDKSILQGIDLELETIGFSPQNVNDYLHIPGVLSPGQIKSVQEFIDRTPVVQGLVNIPVQLDIICFSWGSIPIDKEDITATSLYQAMVRKLWRKDALRLGRSSSGRILKEAEIHSVESHQTDGLMEAEIEFLEYLAFKGLDDNHRIEFDEGVLREVENDLNRKVKKGRLPMQLILHWLKETSFLHTTDSDLDTNAANLRSTWYFLHLTFQEYFAAAWLARHLQVNSNDGEGTSVLMMTPEVTKAFVLKQRYNPRYEIVWWMVAGQLRGESLGAFFDLLQGAPVDLIGGYHHRLLAACLKESRNHLDNKRVRDLEKQLAQWLQLEMIANGRSALGSMEYFPEELQDYLTQSAIEALVNVLQGSGRFKRLAATTLGKQPTLPESALQALIGALQDKNKDVRKSAADALGKHPTLPESALQVLIDALQDENKYVRYSTVKILREQPTLPEPALQALISALQHEDWFIREKAAEALGRQPTLPESSLQALI
ncbi:hypothetical protein BGZ79_000234, partial [Entomortierella chlamydospora]